MVGGAWGWPGDQPRLREPDSAAAPLAACRQFCLTGEQPQTLNNLRPSSGSRPQTPVRCLLQVFEEEHHILYLDHGGVIVAIKDTSIPLKILK